MRNKGKKPKAPPPPSTLFHLLPPSGAGERGNGGYGQSTALLLCRSFSVTLVPCAVGSHPRDAVLDELIRRGLPTGSSSSRTAPDMGPYHGVHPSGENCSNLAPLRAAAPARSPAPAWSPLHGLQVRPGICSGRGLPQAAASVGAGPPAPPWSPPRAAAWNPAPPWYSMGCRGTSCFTMVLTTGRRGLLLRRLEHLSPSFYTDLGTCKAVSHSLDSPGCCGAAIFPCLKYALTEAQNNIAYWLRFGKQWGPSQTWGGF